MENIEEKNNETRLSDNRENNSSGEEPLQADLAALFARWADNPLVAIALKDSRLMPLHWRLACR